MRRFARRQSVALAAALVGSLCACAHQPSSGEQATAADHEFNRPPTDYRREIVDAMHAYLNDPTGIRDAGIGELVVKPVGNVPHYVVCVRLNARKRGGSYVGVKEIAAVFLVGRFDRFLEKAQELCAGTTYAPFPELEKLSR